MALFRAMVLIVSLLATLILATPMPAPYATLLLSRRHPRVPSLVQPVLRVVVPQVATTGVATRTPRLLNATALAQPRLVVVLPQENANANTNVRTKMGKKAIIAREVPLQTPCLVRRKFASCPQSSATRSPHAGGLAAARITQSVSTWAP
jgi:hypothetical protein